MSTPILHVSQLAALLGLPAPPSLESTRLGYDILLVVESWAANLRALPWELLVAPTPSRGRSVRNLTMNAVYPISLLPPAWETGELPWGIRDIDEDLASAYSDSAALADFADETYATWSMFMLEEEETLARADPIVETPRGKLPYSQLLSSQRWHISFHHRQITEYLLGAGVEPPHRFRVEQLPGLALPATVF